MTGPVYSNIFGVLWGEIVHRPILNLLLVFLVAFGGNMGWAIVGLTVLVRLMMRRSTMAATDMSAGMGDMQPKMQKIQEKYKDDPAKQQEEMMKILKSSGGMFKGCLGMLIQIPVFLGLFYVIKDFASGTFNPGEIYSFLTPWLGTLDIKNVDTMFLGMDLLEKNNLLLTILAAVFVYAQSSMMQMVRPKPKIPQMLPNGQPAPDMSKMMGFMNIFMVVMMAGLVWSMEGGVGLYIVTTTLVAVLQYGRKYRSLLAAKFATLTGGKTTPKPEIIE